MRELRNKVAVITGAASGIGRALAEALSNEGARIVIADIEVEALSVAERQLRGSGAEVVAVRTDVSDSKSVDALAQATLEAFGAVHIVCNNAGVVNRYDPFGSSPRRIGNGCLGSICLASSMASERSSRFCCVKHAKLIS